MSKMSELHHDIKAAEALMEQEQNFVRIFDAFVKVMDQQKAQIKELRDTVTDLVNSIEMHGAEKWMPHKVDRAKAVLDKIKG